LCHATPHNASTPTRFTQQSPNQVILLRVADVRFGDLSPRKLDKANLARLAEVDPGLLPPILVDAESMEVVDGTHRLTLAVERGQESIAAIMFHGSRLQALVQAIARNTVHGKPLTKNECRRAAERLLRLDPEIADREVSRLCSISPTTVGEIRRRVTVQSGQSTFRVGHDGRRRAYHPPHQNGSRTSPGKNREHPETTTTKTKSDEAASPRGTGNRAVPAKRSKGAGLSTDTGRWWVSDQALTARCPELAAWFERSDITLDDFVNWTEDIPISRVFEVADEATRRANTLIEIAANIQHRKHP
jgi:hypothetical protein